MISPHLPLERVLDKVATCLGKSREESADGSGGREEEEGEESEGESDGDSDVDVDDDCYYGDDIDVDAMDDQPSHSRYLARRCCYIVL